MEFKNLLTSVVAAGALAFASTSFALPMSLTIDSGTESYTLTDDAITPAGVLSFNSATDGALTGWSLDISSSVSKPVLSAPGSIFQLTSVAVGSGSLTVTAIDYGFSDLGSLSTFNTAILSAGSHATDSVTTEAFVDFGAGFVSLSLWGSNAAATSENYYNLGAGTGSYDLKIVQTFTNNGTANTQVNIPEPSILALFGLGIAGLGFAARKKKQA